MLRLMETHQWLLVEVEVSRFLPQVALLPVQAALTQKEYPWRPQINMKYTHLANANSSKEQKKCGGVHLQDNNKHGQVMRPKYSSFTIITPKLIILK